MRMNSWYFKQEFLVKASYPFLQLLKDLLQRLYTQSGGTRIQFTADLSLEQVAHLLEFPRIRRFSIIDDQNNLKERITA